MSVSIRLFVLLIFSITGFHAAAQAVVGDFLLTARTDHDVISLEEQIRYLDTKPYRLSPLQKTEFRTGVNQLDPSRMEYALRLNPANPWENKNNTKYFQEYQAVLALEKELVLKRALLVRYKHVVELLYANEKVSIREEEFRLVSAQLSVLERQQQSSFFKGDDYLDANLRQMDIMVSREESVFEYDNQFQRMATLYPPMEANKKMWKDIVFISVERMERVVDSLYLVTGTPSTLAYREKQIDLANQEYKLEKSNINAGFVQAEYQEFRINQNRKPWNINMGVTIPITNPNKGDMTKRKLEVIEAQHERDETKSEVLANKEMARNHFKNLVSRYNDIHQKIESLRVGNLASALSNMKENNPTAVIRFQGNVLKLKAMELKLKHEILISYIDFLGFTDQLQKRPLINFLTNNLAVLSVE
ncbi:MAG: hypothetical protein JNM57_07170 [Cyclobacteriaceae bacterium]|nr:hypothetical protein [Cyclobacteriaceae bacterium]